MRDIRPNNSQRKKRTPPPDEVQELFETTQQPRLQARRTKATAAPRRLRGSTVPVAAVTGSGRGIHSDRDHAASTAPTARRRLRPVAPVKAAARVPQSPRRAARSPRVGQRERLMLLVFIGLTAAVALIAGLIFLPTAEITLTLKTAPLLVDETVAVTADGGGEGGSVRGTAFFRELVIEDSVPVETTEVVGKAAAGGVVIINATDQVQPIRERSRLTDTEGHVYFMQKHAIVPAGGRVTVTVDAAEAGDVFNAAAGERLNFAALDASSQSVVYAEVASAGITGGSGETISLVGPADVERAKAQAAEKAREQATGEINGELERGWTILAESWTTELAEFTPAHAEGERVPTLPYRARVTVRVLGYEQAALEEALRGAVESELAENFMLFPGPISYETRVQQVNWEETRAELAVRVTHSTIPALSIPTLREKLAGRSVDEAVQYLEGLPGVERAELVAWPFWVKSVPRIEKRIELHFESDREP